MLMYCKNFKMRILKPNCDSTRLLKRKRKRERDTKQPLGMVSHALVFKRRAASSADRSMANLNARPAT